MIDLFQGSFAVLAALGLVVMLHREPQRSVRVMMLVIAASLTLLGINDLMTLAHGEQLSADAREVVRTVLYGGLCVFVAYRVCSGRIESALQAHDGLRESRQ